MPDAVDPRVVADFGRLVGNRFKLKRAEAYIGDSDCQITVVFDPPVEFRLCGDVVDDTLLDKLLNAVALPKRKLRNLTGYHLLRHQCDDWLDPIYDVEPMDPEDPQVVKYRSFYCYGKSYNLKTGAVEEGDVVSVKRAGMGWAWYA